MTADDQCCMSSPRPASALASVDVADRSSYRSILAGTRILPRVLKRQSVHFEEEAQIRTVLRGCRPFPQRAYEHAKVRVAGLRRHHRFQRILAGLESTHGLDQQLLLEPKW